MKHFDAFAGMGGFTLALKNIFGDEYQNVGFAEINPHATANYLYNFPNHKHYGDITTIQPEDLGAIDIFTGGFPCQAFSIAGKRRGFEDCRGTLFFEIARLCSHLLPKYLLLENVKGLLNHENGRTFSTIYQTLTDIGYTVEFQVLNTKWFLPQNRERLYIIGHLATASRGFQGIFPIGENEEFFRNTPKTNQTKFQAKNYSTTIKTNGHIRADDTFIEVGTLRTHKDGQGFRKIKENICPTLPARARTDGSGQAVIRQLPRGKNKGADLPFCPTISSNAFEQNNFVLSYTLDEKGKVNHYNKKEVANTLHSSTGSGGNTDQFVGGIRRLTEIECERLQGFPDNWTKYGNYNGAIKEIAKTQRYKMIGNAVTVNVVEEICKKLKNNLKYGL